VKLDFYVRQLALREVLGKARLPVKRGGGAVRVGADHDQRDPRAARVGMRVHRMLHRSRPMLTVEQLLALISA
jgi:hypothetical protein